MNGTVQNLKEAWQKMPGKTKKMIAVIAAGTIILAAAGLLVLNIGTKKGYSTLFTGMSSDDAQAVVSLLQDEGVDYRYNDKNGSVQVMSDTVDKIVVAADVLEFVQGLTEWISYIMMLKYGGTSIGNESVTEPSRARADEKRRAEWLKPVRRHILL